MKRARRSAKPHGREMTAFPESIPDTVATRIQAIADEHPDHECELAGGLAAWLDDHGKNVRPVRKPPGRDRLDVIPPSSGASDGTL